MARATSPFQTQDYGQPGAGEWQELRGELVALLDQVETQVARTARPEPAYDALAERMRDLRHQVAEVEPDTRHREALRSVQRAIDKFSERDVPVASNPRDTLEAAIQQIRSRHFVPPAQEAAVPQPSAPIAPPPRFDELADAVGGISARLERLEGELKNQAKGQTANVREIADQMGQLSHVVEMLAGAVGETGQVKRLEGQIAGLARLIGEGPKLDAVALNNRLDDVAATVTKLAELQKHYADRSDVSGVTARLDDVTATVGRLADLQMQASERDDVSAMTARLDDVSATVGRLADLQVQFASKVENPRDGLKESMTAIEDGLRGIYDRIDAIERSMAIPPAELENITSELGRVAQAIKSPQQPQGLIELIDALNDRISDIEARSADVGGLKLEMEALRNTVVMALEPRFAAIETKIDTLSEQVTAERPADPGIAQLEKQVRQLVARMDQTGEQLTGLAKLYAAPAEQAMPDYSEIADLVAERTADAMKRTAPVASSLDEAGFAEIEKRVARVMKVAATEKPSAETIALEATIREVNDRLQRLETSLEKRQAEPAPAPVAPPAPVAAAPIAPKPAAAIEPAIVAEAPTAKLAPAAATYFAPLTVEAEPTLSIPAFDPADSMPAAPDADAPLYDKPFAPADAVASALGLKIDAPASSPRSAMPSLEELENEIRPVFDPSLAERPPQPKSTLDLPDDDVFVSHADEPVAPAVSTEPQPSRNTFIEAHRRAARQAAVTRPAMLPAVDSGSLIGRAFARFQASHEATTDAAAPAVVGMPPKPETNRPLKKLAEPKVKAKKEPKAKPEPKAKVKPEPKLKPEPAAKKPGRFSLFKSKGNARQLAGDKDPPSQWQPDEPVAAHVLPVAPEPSLIALGAEETSPLADGAIKPRQSFLLRHKQPILLAASVVALACLTINLINQRMKPEDGTPAPSSASADVSDASMIPVPLADQAFEPKTPRIVLDTLTTGSIDGTAQKFVAGTPEPPLPLAFEAATEVALADVPKSLGPVQPLPAALESPVKVEPPPAAVGPEPLLAAAGNGDARAQFEVAAIYTEGRAVPEDLKAAAMWYERAASQGFAPAQYRLGNLYENGRGVEKDINQARLWYQQAAEAGNRMAMHNLAALYAGGGLGTQQFDAAAKWFEEAANRGMKDSQFNLGMLYARGLGVKQDLNASFKWFSLAANRGDKDAAKARDDIASSLGAGEVQTLIADVTAFKPEPIDFVANFAPIGTWSAKFDPGETITDKRVVSGVQMALNQLGFDVGTPDGVAGDKTAQAIRSFETQTGMTESGKINPRLLAVLGSQPV